MINLLILSIKIVSFSILWDRIRKKNEFKIEVIVEKQEMQIDQLLCSPVKKEKIQLQDIIMKSM